MLKTESARQVAESLGVWREGMEANEAASAVADRLEEIYTRIGVPTRLRQIDVRQDDFQAIANETVKNFNFNSGQRSAADQVADAVRLLEAAW